MRLLFLLKRHDWMPRQSRRSPGAMGVVLGLPARSVPGSCVPDGTVAMSRWLSLEQIRKQQRMRRDRVIEAMESGELPYEQRGRIRYARECDVQAWEETRLRRSPSARPSAVHPDFSQYL